MSHQTEIQAEIRDIDALKSACQELDINLVQNQETRGYNQTFVCDWCITWPGAVYDVQVNRQPDGQLKLSADFFFGYVAKKLGCPQGNTYEERNIGLLIQTYTKHKVLKEASIQGMFCTNQTINQAGNVVLELQSY